MENCCIIYFRGAKICEPSTDSRKLVIIINISTRERFKKFFNMSNPGCMSTIFSILSHVDICRQDGIHIHTSEENRRAESGTKFS